MAERAIAHFLFQSIRQSAHRDAALKMIVGKTVMLDEDIAEVRMLRYSHTPECEVIVLRRGSEIRYRCRDYDIAMKWARVECRSYRTSKITVERVDRSHGERQDDRALDARRLILAASALSARASAVIRAARFSEGTQSEIGRAHV